MTAGPERHPGVVEQAVGARVTRRLGVQTNLIKGNTVMLGTILIIVLVLFLIGGFSGRFGGYGYGYGHGGIGVLGVLLVVVVVLLLMGQI